MMFDFHLFLAMQLPPSPPPGTQHEAAIPKSEHCHSEIDEKTASKRAFAVMLQNGFTLLSLVIDYFVGNYREISIWAIGVADLALLYVISPIDFIPDFIPVVGFLDDAVVLALCLKLLK